MTYSYSEDGKSCYISSPNPLRFWHNQLFNDDGYNADVTNAGHGSSRYINENAWYANLNAREERFVYLRDEESKRCWSVGKYPLMEPVDRLFCEHSMAYSRIETDNLGIAAAWTIFVPVHGTHEVWMLRLQNRSQQTRTLSTFAVLSFDLGGFAQPAYYQPYNCTATSYDSQLQGIFAKNENPHNPHKRYNGFLAGSREPVGYDGSLERFFGIMGSAARPERLLSGENCTNSRTTVLGLGAVLQNTLTLAPGQEQTIYFAAGLAESLEEARQTALEAFCNPQQQLDRAQAQMSRRYGALKTFTPDKRVNILMNDWVQKQVDFNSLGKKAVRDNAQIAMAQLNFQPEKAERTLLECLPHQYQNGRAVLHFGPTVNPNLFSDPHMWLILGCCELVKETGDLSFLRKVLPFQDGGEASIYDHLKRAMQYMQNDLGTNGIPRIHYADWNDALNTDDETAESVFMAMAMAWACKELAALSQFLGDEAYASQLLESRRILTETINREAWDGEWYLRAFTKDGPIGAKSSPTGGKIYVNPQSWSILADVVPPERLEAVLKAIDGMDTRYGIPLCKPAYETFDRHVGRMSGMLPGLFENGGVYNHANAFKMMADCKVGRGNQAYETLKKMMPDSETNPSSVSGAEPYVFVNCWCMHPAFYTRIWFSWSTGTSGWALRGFYEGICGLRRDYAGLRVQPCLPDAWKEAEVWRTFRGCRYHVRIENTKTGKTTVFVDGVQQASNLLPVFADGKEHEVVVRT